MKTIAKPKVLAPRRHRNASARNGDAKLTDEEFRRQLHIDLADEIAAAQASFAKTHGHLLRPHTPAEIKASDAKWRAMEEEARKNPVSKEESESYDRMLARMAAERADWLPAIGRNHAEPAAPSVIPEN